jgi:hypothetical protein
MTSPRCDQRTYVDDHFAGRLAVARERQMRTHLVDCGDCRDRYQRHLALSRLDPRALGFEDRMRRGLGLAPAGLAGRTVGLTAFAFTLAMGAFLLLPRLPALMHPEAAETADGFHARGGGPNRVPLAFAMDDRGSAVSAFRTNGPGAPAPALDRIHIQDELAFAYRNGGGWSHLMVFARNPGGNVFWFYPQWTDAAADPVGVQLASNPGTHELSTAVRHDLAAGNLEFCAVMSRQALSVHQVEGALRAHKEATPARALADADRVVTCRNVEVVP